MTELTINFGTGPVRFREETWGGMIALLSQILDCVQPTGPIECRIEELFEPGESDWLEAYEAAQDKIARLNAKEAPLAWPEPIIEEEE